MKITFDSNTYRQVLNPAKGRDTTEEVLSVIKNALDAGRIEGYLSETIGTLEGVKKEDRISHFSGSAPSISFIQEGGGNNTKLSFTIGLDNSQGFELPNTVVDYLNLALTNNFLFLRAPRIGLQKPSYFNNNKVFVNDFGDDQAYRQEIFAKVGREIEARGVGRAIIVGLANKIQPNKDTPWYKLLAYANDEQTKTAVKKAVGEWADGDSIAAHIAYKNDYFCTLDKGNSAGGNSILNDGNKAWLKEKYNLNFITLTQLSNLLNSNSI